MVGGSSSADVFNRKQIKKHCGDIRTLVILEGKKGPPGIPSLFFKTSSFHFFQDKEEETQKEASFPERKFSHCVIYYVPGSRKSRLVITAGTLALESATLPTYGFCSRLEYGIH